MSAAPAQPPTPPTPPPAAPPAPENKSSRPTTRDFFLDELEAVARTTEDEHLRVAACSAGLRAIAQIQAADQRDRRLAQRDRLIGIAERQLALQERRDARAQERYQHALAAEADSRSQEHAPAANPTQPAHPGAHPPLQPDELKALETFHPHGDPMRFRKPDLARHYRGVLASQRYWSGFWDGHTIGQRLGRGETVLTTDPIPGKVNGHWPNRHHFPPAPPPLVKPTAEHLFAPPAIQLPLPEGGGRGVGDQRDQSDQSDQSEECADSHEPAASAPSPQPPTSQPSGP